MSSGPNSSAGKEAEGREERVVQGRAEGVAQGRTWGSFRLLELVGKGNFGEVYRAWDPHLERDVGLKILLGGPRETRHSPSHCCARRAL
jgi:serine/threonine protein kinase